MNGVKAKKTKEKLAVMFTRKPKIWSFDVVVLQRTAKTCTKNAKRKCRVFFWLINPIVLWRSRCRRCRHCLSFHDNGARAQPNGVNLKVLTSETRLKAHKLPFSGIRTFKITRTYYSRIVLEVAISYANYC